MNNPFNKYPKLSYTAAAAVVAAAGIIFAPITVPAYVLYAAEAVTAIAAVTASVFTFVSIAKAFYGLIARRNSTEEMTATNQNNSPEEVIATNQHNNSTVMLINSFDINDIALANKRDEPLTTEADRQNASTVGLDGSKMDDPENLGEGMFDHMYA